jgi:plastocyanin
MRTILLAAALLALTAPLTAALVPVPSVAPAADVAGVVPVQMTLFGFVPPVAAALPGASVQWCNTTPFGIAPHTATAVLPAGAYNTGFVFPGGCSTQAMPAGPAVILYRCLLHPWMVGTVIVA